MQEEKNSIKYSESQIVFVDTRQFTYIYGIANGI